MLTLVFFLHFVAGSTMFMHFHNIDGQVVAHSHPMIPGAHHTHTAAQCVNLGIMQSVLAGMDVAHTDEYHPAVSKGIVLQAPEISLAAVHFLYVKGPRAPPVA